MPQVDLGTLLSSRSGGSSDHKIACETTAPQPDYPPESFWLSKDAEIDWFDRNALYERNESTKGNSNPNPIPNHNSSSQRFSINIKSKASIIGLPKTQKTNYVDKNRKKKGSKPGKLFPKRTGSVNKPAVQLAEPSSPNVSCIGRVKSKRKNRKRVEPENCRSKGICKQFLSMFRSKPVDTGDEPGPERARSRGRKTVPVRTGGFVVEPDPPGLGGMKRFASGRRSSSSAADVGEVVG